MWIQYACNVAVAQYISQIISLHMAVHSPITYIVVTDVCARGIKWTNVHFSCSRIIFNINFGVCVLTRTAGHKYTLTTDWLKVKKWGYAEHMLDTQGKYLL